jgi:hypothetical protein
MRFDLALMDLGPDTQIHIGNANKISRNQDFLNTGFGPQLNKNCRISKKEYDVL